MKDRAWDRSGRGRGWDAVGDVEQGEEGALGGSIAIAEAQEDSAQPDTPKS